jgi:NAD(P)H-flavin reductase
MKLNSLKSSSTRLMMLAASVALVGAMFASTATAFAPPSLGVVRPTFAPQQTQQQQYVPRRQQSSPVLFMGWGPEPVWSEAEVKTLEQANQSGNSVLVTVAVPPETAAEYKVPGQYVQVRLNNEDDTKPLFLAIASPPAPENAVFEFLIKKTDGNEWMTSASAGTKVEISQVLGGGFPMEENLDGFKYDFPTQNILLFGAGSGIAPLRAAMESGQLNVAKAGEGGRTARLYYGVQTADDLCFVDKCKLLCIYSLYMIDDGSLSGDRLLRLWWVDDVFRVFFLTHTHFVILSSSRS